jgi:hypothetical protein
MRNHAAGNGVRTVWNEIWHHVEIPKQSSCIRVRLKGGNKTAQGNALGLAVQESKVALKGPGKRIRLLRDQNILPLQGDGSLEATGPRALPWAIISWPFRRDVCTERI